MSNEINKRLEKIQKELTANKLAQEAYPYLRDKTPYLTGNARSNTKLSNDSILGQYPYAKRLDDGYSKKAPDGMIKPTIEFIRKFINRYSKGK